MKPPCLGDGRAAVPRLCIVYPGICPTTEENSLENLIQGNRRACGWSALNLIRLVDLAIAGDGLDWPAVPCRPWLSRQPTRSTLGQRKYLSICHALVSIEKLIFISALPKLLEGVCGRWLVKRAGATTPPYQISYSCSFSEVWISLVSLSVSTLKKTYLSFWVVRDCAVGIARRSGDLIPVEARFSAPVQTGPGTHPASCTSDTVSFPGVKRPVRGVDRPPPFKLLG